MLPFVSENQYFATNVFFSNTRFNQDFTYLFGFCNGVVEVNLTVGTDVLRGQRPMKRV